MSSSLVIIPAYNEASHIGGVIDSTRSVVDWDLLVVNDGSEDDTPEVVKQKGVYLINHPVNLGYGAALQTGFRFAKERNYDAVVTMDGDGQHDPMGIITLKEVAEREGADVVIGSRFLEGPYRMPIARRIGSWLFSQIARAYTGRSFTDPTSGFQFLKRRAFSYLASSVHYPLDYPDVNIIILLHKRGFKVVEAPVRMFESPDRDSMHRGLSPVVYVLRMFLAITLILIKKED